MGTGRTAWRVELRALSKAKCAAAAMISTGSARIGGRVKKAKA